jgi:hypothetical protein
VDGGVELVGVVVQLFVAKGEARAAAEQVDGHRWIVQT